MGELPKEARFAHAGLSYHGHDLAVASLRLVQDLPEDLNFRFTTDEPAETTTGYHIQPPPQGAGSYDLVNLERVAQTLDSHRADGLNLDVAFCQTEGGLGNQYCSRHSRLFHSGGQVGRLPDGCVIHLQVAADGPDDDLAGPYRMVLLSQGGAEQGHDPVAHDLVDGPLVAVDGLHHVFKHRVEELPRLLGVAVGKQLHGPLQVREQHRDLLALAFQRALGGEDLLGEVRGGVGLGRSEPRGDDRPGRAGLAQRLAALFAELRIEPIGLTATGAA
jgi:hypothetical protein